MNYDEWFARLDRWGARKRSHADIARYLRDEGLSAWWAQKIAIHYEQARGMRQAHERKRGFAVTVSKTIDAPVGELFDLFVDGRRRKRWLVDGPMKMRTSTRPRSARFDWNGGTSRVNVTFEAKGPSRAIVAVEHDRIEGRQTEALKAMWKSHLARLGAAARPD